MNDVAGAVPSQRGPFWATTNTAVRLSCTPSSSFSARTSVRMSPLNRWRSSGGSVALLTFMQPGIWSHHASASG